MTMSEKVPGEIWDKKTQTFIKPTKKKKALAEKYFALRKACASLEDLIGDPAGFSEKELKELDKAVTVMKAAFKMVKRVIRADEKEGFQKIVTGSWKTQSTELHHINN